MWSLFKKLQEYDGDRQNNENVMHENDKMGYIYKKRQKITQSYIKQKILTGTVSYDTDISCDTFVSKCRDGVISYINKIICEERNKNKENDAININEENSCNNSMNMDIDIVNVQNRHGCSGLYWACVNGHIEIAEILLQNGADVNMVNMGDYRYTALHGACEQGYPDIFELLINYGVDVNSKDGNEKTALWWSCFYGREECVRVLLENKAEIFCIDSIGRSCLDIAKEKGHDHIIQQIQEWVKDQMLIREFVLVVEDDDENNDCDEDNEETKEETIEELKQQLKETKLQLYQIKAESKSLKKQLEIAHATILEKDRTLEETVNTLKELEIQATLKTT